jgi:hypothetical protein
LIFYYEFSDKLFITDFNVCEKNGKD